MVTATDDFSERMTAVEVAVQEMNAELRVVNPRLIALETAVAEQRTDIRQLNARLDSFQSDINARLDTVQSEANARLATVQSDINGRIDSLGARIERVFWAVIAVGLIVGAGIVGTMLTLVFRLTT